MTILRFLSPLGLVLAISASTTACKEGGGDGGQPQSPSDNGPGKNEPVKPGEIKTGDYAKSETASDDGSVDGAGLEGKGTDFSKLKPLQLTGVVALGLVETEGGAGLLDDGGNGEKSTLLSTVNASGDIKALGLTDLGFDPNQTRIENIFKVGANGVFIRGEFGHVEECVDAKGKVTNQNNGGSALTADGPGAPQKPTEPVKCYGYEVRLIWIKPDGKMAPISAKTFGYEGEQFEISRIQYTDDGRLWVQFWAENVSSVGYYHFDDETFVVVTDPKQNIDEFVATATGSVYIRGRVIATGAEFQRRIKETSTGFEVMSRLPQFALGSDAFVPDVEGLYTQVISVVGDQMKFRYLPISIRNNLFEFSSGQFTDSELPTVGNRWLISRTQTGGSSEPLIAFDIGAREIPGEAFRGTMIDDSLGLVFDGVNVLQIAFNSATGATTSTVYKALRYSKDLGGLIVRDMYGPAQGFTGWTAVGAKPNDSATYWLTVDPATGVVDLDGRHKLKESGADFPVNFARKIGSRTLVSNTSDGDTYEFGTTGLDDILVTKVTSLNGRSALTHQGAELNGKLYYFYANSADEFDPANGLLTTANGFYCEGVAMLRNAAGTGLAGFMNGDCDGLGGDQSEYIEFGIDFDRANATAIATLDPSSRLFQYWAKLFRTSTGQVAMSDGNFTDTGKLYFMNPARTNFTHQRTQKVANTSNQIRRFGDGFGSIEVIAPWGTDSVLIAGLIDNEYKSRLYNVETGVTLPMNDLTGTQLYYAKTIGSRFILNGLDVGTAMIVNKTYNVSDRSIVSESSETSVKVVKIVETANP